MNAKPIAWALVTATVVATSAGLVVPELGLAVASVMLGGAALATSMLARKPVARYPGEERMEAKVETTYNINTIS